MQVKRNKGELIIIGLVLSGWNEEKMESQHRVFTHPKENYRLFVGRSGALRKGDLVQTSHPLLTMSKDMVKKAEEALPKMTKEEVWGIVYRNSNI